MNHTRASHFLNITVAAALTAAVAIPAMTHEAPEGSYWGSVAQIRSQPPLPSNVPKWNATYAERFPGCTSRKATTPVDLVVVDQQAQAHRVDFATAWHAGHNAEWADDVYVVGWCR